jgi:hypothetical protein
VILASTEIGGWHTIGRFFQAAGPLHQGFEFVPDRCDSLPNRIRRIKPVDRPERQKEIGEKLPRLIKEADHLFGFFLLQAGFLK